MHKCAPFLCPFLWLLGILFSVGFAQAQQSSSTPPAQNKTAVPAQDAPAVWQPTTIREGNFSIIFPVNAKREGTRSRIQLTDGTGVETRFTATTPEGNYQVAFTFLSENIATPQGVRQRFSTLLKNLQANPQITWLSGGEIEYRGNPGIELKVQMGENKIITWSRQYFAFGCIYEVTARYTPREPESREPQIFLDSFELFGPPIQRPTLATPQESLPDFTPLTPDLYYVVPATLRAHAVAMPEPKFDFKREVYRGTVTLLVTVSTEGKVIGAESANGSPALLEPVFKALKKWRFTPFRANGKAVNVQGRLTFNLGDSKTP
jgi:TonB family protein